MAHVIGFKLQTASDDQRDDLLERLIVLLNNMMQPGDELSMTLKNEQPTARGKRQVTQTVEWQAGEPAPTLIDFGIVSSQHDLFDLASKLRAAGIELHPLSVPISTSDTPSDQQTSAPSDDTPRELETPLTPLERMIDDALRENPISSDDEQTSSDDQTPSDDQ